MNINGVTANLEVASAGADGVVRNAGNCLLLGLSAFLLPPAP